MFDEGLGVLILLIFNWLVLAYFIGINGAYFSLLFISYFELLRYSRTTRHERWRRILQSPLTLPVSVIAPAYNEEVPIVESVRSLSMLQYPRKEVVVVNDGSRDRCASSSGSPGGTLWSVGPRRTRWSPSVYWPGGSGMLVAVGVASALNWIGCR